MKLDRGRLARKDHLAVATGNPRRAPLALLAAVVTLALAAAPLPAQAAPGGAASTVAFSPSEEGIVFSPLRTAGATWYGPTLYGNHTACGQVLRPSTIGVANRTLPCGTTVKFVYHGNVLITRVIDRGPYSKGNSWDLTNGAREALGFEGADEIHYAVATSFARQGH